jgi:aspartyl-tRNA(Asn)/glutamyl-tRNA(Gln) amidotransferase subunit C
MSLTRLDVAKIASLARIELSESETDATLLQLQDIFGLIEKMQAVDTKGVAPLTTPLAAIDDVTLRMREDRVTEIDQRDELMALAPASEDGLYLVPRVVE